MIASGSQNQLQSSLAPLGDLLKALMFLSNLNSLNSSPSLPVQGFNQRKGSSRVWKEKGSKWFYHSSLSPFSCFACALLVWFAFMFWVSLVFILCFLQHVFVWLFFGFSLFCFSYKKIKKNFEKSEKYKSSVFFVYIDTCVPWMAIETKFSKLFISCSLDEHLHA